MMLFCGAALSVEFNDGVGRLNFPLPVPRWAFFFGKYLASLIASLAFAFLMYGLAWAMTAASFTTMLPSLYTESLVLTVLCVFMCNAICFAVGSVIKRSGGMSFALIFAIMPMALLMVSGFITLDIKAAIEWLPFEAIDMIVCNFGVAPYTLSGLMVYGIQGYTIPMVDCYLQCLIWGIGCLVLGYVSTVRKEVR
jgi:ABC-type transport system involved in multi-copper enzyme maturation permease subunit